MKKLTCLPAGKVLPILLVFVCFLVPGSLFPIKAQESERSVTMMNFEGEDIKIWGDDDQACTAIRSGNTDCQAIADKCVKDGGCAPQLATLSFMGCEKCDAQAKPCFDAIEADYKQCIKTAAAKYKEEQSSPESTNQQKTSPPVQDVKYNKEDKLPYGTGKIPVFINEWFNWVAEWIKVNAYVLSLESESWEEEKEEEKREIEELKKKQAEIKARLEADWEWQARETFWKSVTEAKFVAGPGDQSEVYKQPAAEYKKGGNNEFEPLSEMQILNHGDVIQVTRRAIIRTPNYVIELYPKGAYEEKAVVELRDGKLLLKHGAVTIWKGRMYGEYVGTQYVWEGVETPVLDAVDVQTQYTVAHDEKANKSYVIVSEGEVKVTTKDGKTATITPNGGKPGIAVVSQKPSFVKLAIAGVVLAAVLGGTLMVLRRKFAPKGFSKKKR